MKRAVRKIFSPRLLVLLALTAVAIPAALVASTVASSADGIPVSNPAHPVIDANWIYDHNFFESNNFIYKVAGSDGCLPTATTCSPGGGTAGDANNLPQNYNGAQEFYKWWGGVATTHTPQPNGPLGYWITARDHLFPTRSWQLNDAELTIPGAVCAGQQVMLASHNDSTPVSAVNTGVSATPMSGMHSGNWGNGSAYDANMGENMNLEEIGSVLRWHEVNGTYPARTIKATLYDNEEGGLVGSGDYSAAGAGGGHPLSPDERGRHEHQGDECRKRQQSDLRRRWHGRPRRGLDREPGRGVRWHGGDEHDARRTCFSGRHGHQRPERHRLLGRSDTQDRPRRHRRHRDHRHGRDDPALGDHVVGRGKRRRHEHQGRVASRTWSSARTSPSTTASGTSTSARSPRSATAGAAGTGVTLQNPLAFAHAVGASAQDLGSGITLTSPLAFAHPAGAHVIDTSALGTGVTVTAPLTKAHIFGSTVNGSATGLLSDSPQGQIIGVFNNDQDGLNYPARKWGTGYYMSNLLDGQAGAWFNNINATPVSAAPNNIYGAVGIQRLQHNLPAVQAFRTSSANAVTQALQDLGQKYNFSMPLENPLVFKNTGSVPDTPGPQTVPAYLPSDQALYTPVLDDLTGRTDQVSFGVRGIPSLGDIGQYDSNTNPLVGGNDNPYPSGYPSKPTIAGEFGQDSYERLLLEPQLLGVRHRAWSGRLRSALGRAAARRRVHRHVVLLRSRLAAGRRRGGAAGPPDRVLRDDPEEADRADHRQLRRGLQQDEVGLHGRAHVLLGLRGRKPDGHDDRPDDPAHLPDAGGLA